MVSGTPGLAATTKWKLVFSVGLFALFAADLSGHYLPLFVSPVVAWALFLGFWGGLVVMVGGALGFLLADHQRAAERPRRAGSIAPRSGRLRAPATGVGPERCPSCGIELPFQAPICPACGSSQG